MEPAHKHPTLLIIDDEPAILHAFRRVFAGKELQLLTAETARAGLELFQQNKPDVVILDVRLPDQSGLEVFERLRKINAKTPVIFITGHGTTETAIEATKRGAFDYLFKPLELSELRKLVDNALRVSLLQSVPALMTSDDVDADRADVIVGRSSAMNDVYKAIGQVAPQDVTVLILGESGTGKELVARAIYHHSKRTNGPFLAINCAAIPEEILESEIFGHEKGAFTGAQYQRIGKFEQCSGGTLFLDEVGDMSASTQAKFLRVLQEQTFERVGGNEMVHTDVRIVASTNRDLEKLVASGEFRDDLYFRLSTFTIKLPTLRERDEDLDLLVAHFLHRFGRELNKTVTVVAPEVIEIFRRYRWPGNVRELQSVIKQSLLRSSGGVLIPEFLPDYIQNWDPSTATSESSAGDFDVGHWDDFVANRISENTENLYAESSLWTDRHLLLRVLRHTHGNQLQAARILGISRATLRNKLRAVGIRVEEIQW